MLCDPKVVTRLNQFSVRAPGLVSASRLVLKCFNTSKSGGASLALLAPALQNPRAASTPKHTSRLHSTSGFLSLAVPLLLRKVQVKSANVSLHRASRWYWTVKLLRSSLSWRRFHPRPISIVKPLRPQCPLWWSSKLR